MIRPLITTLLILLTLTATSCLPDITPKTFDQIIGSPGHEPGKFHRPRGIVFDEGNELFYVVDWDGRVQKFDEAGNLLTHWMMPAIKQGKPESMVLTEKGTLLVTDTHYSRVVEFSSDGEVVSMFGSYGREDGQFIYPVGICLDNAGRVYVSEYGENDRIQIFSPEGKFVGAFGTFGTEPGQFQRPSGLAMTPDEHLYVADAVNHRIQVFDLEGNLLKIIGKQGREAGEFTYPYDVAVRPPHLYVLEYGNQRVQKLTLDGEPIASFGKGGSGDGCLAAPWRFTTAKDYLLISDTNNSRVVKVDF